VTEVHMTDLSAWRRFYAEEVQTAAGLKSPQLVEALASIPRERFLPPGPWTIRSEADLAGGMPRQTPDADPRHVCHNVAIAIDASRNLYNGTPGLIGMAIDRLALKPGDRAMHIGAGTGYYSALMAHCVGAGGHLVALEADEQLAARAKANLAAMPWADVRHADGSQPFDGTFDAVLVNAGLTHPPDDWLAAVKRGGRMILPLTASMPAMGNIGKGLLVMLTRGEPDADWEARTVTFVAIFNAVGVRDEAIGVEVAKALQTMPFPQLKRLRRDEHAKGAGCWLHVPRFCLSTAA
jgi:protein-L-isoaspartate(D-aspartate) O-methyltransferase